MAGCYKSFGLRLSALCESHSPDDDRHNLQYGVLETVDEEPHRQPSLAHPAHHDAQRHAEHHQTDDVRPVSQAHAETGDAVFLLLCNKP